MRFRRLLPLCLLILALTACSSDWLDDFIGEPSPTPRPTPVEIHTPTPAPTPLVINLMDLTTGLEGLASYRIDFTTTFEMVDMAGTPIRRLIRYQYFKHGEDSGYYLRVSNTDDPTEIFQQSGLYQIDNKYFQIYGTHLVPVECSRISEEMALPLHESRFTPQKVVGALTELTLAEEDVAVNGILADRFTYTQENQQLVQYTAAFGEVWVAVSEGYVLRLTGQAQGPFALVGTNGEGLLAWDYLLSEINTLDAVTLPEICNIVGIPDIVLPEEAVIQNQGEGFISFIVPQEPPETATFFRQTYPSLGWTLEEDAKSETTYVMSFSQDERRIYITVSPPEGEGALVIITE